MSIRDDTLAYLVETEQISAATATLFREKDAELAKISDLAQRSAVGSALFGKRYHKLLDPLVGVDPVDAAPANRWRLTWGDKSWTEDDLTGAHLAVIVLIHGRDEWEVVSPLAGPVRLMAVLSAFIAIDEARAYPEVNAELSTATASALLAAVSMF